MIGSALVLVVYRVERGPKSGTDATVSPERGQVGRLVE
jgi:hypothetical protein